jgi:Carboxypeptidase regulatory-like domain
MILRGKISWERKSRTNRCPSLCSMALLAFAAAAAHLAVPAGFAQTASTGAITGTVLDPSDKLVPGAALKLINEETGENRNSESKRDGTFEFFLLLPGSYRMEVSKNGFKVANYRHVRVAVTETTALDIRLAIGSASESVTVQASPVQLETESSALGRVTDEQSVDNLPLVTRNYTQIIALSPGVSNDVENATAVGPGGGGLSAGATGFSAHGSATNDNNYQMNGVQVNDLMAAGNLSSGVPIPNPDTIQEFKVQTSQYDASYGRNAGANVDVVTKAGSNDFHGTAFEFFRNDVLNANDFFLKEHGQPRPPLKENQFGFTLGGPVKRDKLLFFTSYQGTRQRNGYDVNAACLQTFLSPPLTNDRSRAGLGAVFNGQMSNFGTPVASNGSNIDPVALEILGATLPNGSFLIPTPQTINPNMPFDVQGSTSIEQSCAFNEDQFVTNADFLMTSRSRLTGRFFFSDGNQSVTLPPSQLIAGPSFSGFPRTLDSAFRDFSLTWTYVFNSNLLNQAIAGYNRTKTKLGQSYPQVTLPGGGSPVTFNFSNLGVTAPAFDDPFPSIAIEGAGGIGGNGQGVTLTQNVYDFEDNVTWVRGRHSIHFGGGINRTQLNEEAFHFLGGVIFAGYQDFLLGQVFESVDVPGLFDRAWRTWDGNLFVQDDFRALPRLTLNLGFRWDRLGAVGDEKGRSAIFDPALANPNPPPGGTLQGFVVASNFSGGPIPAGVVQAGNNSATREVGQNGWEPRIGFSWQLPHTDRLVLRGGYGIYRSRTTAQPILQLLTDPPFGEERILGFGITQLTPLSFENPFAGPATLPSFAAYSPATALSIFTVSPTFQPPIVQQYSLNLQTQLARDFLLEVGYEGARGTKLELVRSFNQALSASAADPIRGQMDNTFSNVQLRVPIEGFAAGQSLDVQSSGASWFNALDVSVTKRFSHGLQFLASYTWASALSDVPGFTTGANGGVVTGDQNNPLAAYGPDSFVRRNRFVFSYYYSLPGPKDLHTLEGRFLGGWALSGVTTFQSGHRLSILDINATAAFGDPAGLDRAQIAPGCTNSQLTTHGSVNSRLNNFFNPNCFVAPPVIGADGLATAFGDSGTGIISGPDQRNFDIAILKRTPLTERFNLDFRAEFFNAFNTSQFADPNSLIVGEVVGSNLIPIPGFGEITATSVNPRIIQLALKLNF